MLYFTRQRQSCPTCKEPWKGRSRISITSSMLTALVMTSQSWPGYIIIPALCPSACFCLQASVCSVISPCVGLAERPVCALARKTKTWLAGLKVRAEKQREWEQKFTQHLERREQSHADVSWLQSMPQHCVQENRSKSLLIGSGLVAACLQLAAVYVILSLLLRIPIKGD